MDSYSDKNLKLATYMCPSISVSYYEMLASYLEAQLGITTTLLYDSRRPGPNLARGDANFIDVAFVTTTSYLENFSSEDSQYKLLAAGSVTSHITKGEVLGYYTDIVLHRDLKERVKEFLDVRGCSFAYSQETSISAAKQVLITLKQMGENASFFSNVHSAGDQYSALDLVLAKKVECTAVSSISYAQFLKQNYFMADELFLQESWGPLPPSPILINKNMSDAKVSSITEALLRMHKTPGWKEELNKFGVVKFESISDDIYLVAKELLRNTKSLTLGVTYY